MTKLKSKKMTKSTFAIIIMAIAMVAMLAFGGTYAYFTASATALTDETTTGKVSLTSTGTITLKDTVLPTEEIYNGTVTFSAADSTVDTWVFVKFSATFEGQDNTDNILDISSGAGNTDWQEIDADNNIWGKKTKVTAGGSADFAVVVSLANISEHDAQEDSKALVYMGKKVTVIIDGASVQGTFESVTAAAAHINWAETDSNAPAAQG